MKNQEGGWPSTYKTKRLISNKLMYSQKKRNRRDERTEAKGDARRCLYSGIYSLFAGDEKTPALPFKTVSLFFDRFVSDKWAKSINANYVKRFSLDAVLKHDRAPMNILRPQFGGSTNKKREETPAVAVAAPAPAAQLVQAVPVVEKPIVNAELLIQSGQHLQDTSGGGFTSDEIEFALIRSYRRIYEERTLGTQSAQNAYNEIIKYLGEYVGGLVWMYLYIVRDENAEYGKSTRWAGRTGLVRVFEPMFIEKCVKAARRQTEKVTSAIQAPEPEPAEQEQEEVEPAEQEEVVVAAEAREEPSKGTTRPEDPAQPAPTHTGEIIRDLTVEGDLHISGNLVVGGKIEEKSQYEPKQSSEL